MRSTSSAGLFGLAGRTSRVLFEDCHVRGFIDSLCQLWDALVALVCNVEHAFGARNLYTTSAEEFLHPDHERFMVR